MDKTPSSVEHTLDRVLAAPLSRAGFLRWTGIIIAALAFPFKNKQKLFAAAGKTLSPRTRRNVTTPYDMTVATGNDPAAITRAAIDALGGISLFVKPGDTVVIKPNIGWDRSPEQAGNTNPAVIHTLVTLCREAKAKTVKVFDTPCNDIRKTYQNSGIEKAVKDAGGIILYPAQWKYLPGQFPSGAAMSDWPIYQDAVACDCFINVPVAKHHGLTDVTLSIKNLMGVCGGSRGTMHWNIAQKLAELAAFIQPDLTVIDAYRILLRHGPTGGNLADVEQRKTIIASADPVLADSYAASFFNKLPQDIGYIKASAQMGLGSMDIKKARIKKVSLA